MQQALKEAYKTLDANEVSVVSVRVSMRGHNQCGKAYDWLTGKLTMQIQHEINIATAV